MQPDSTLMCGAMPLPHNRRARVTLRVLTRRFLRPSALSALLLCVFAAFLTAQAGQGANIKRTCPVCIPNGCSLDPGESTEYVGTISILACIDADQDGIGHCCKVWRDEYNIFDAPKERPGRQPIGNCFKTYCLFGFVTPLACARAWVAPGHPVRPHPAPPGHGKASARFVVPKDVCTEGGKP